MADTTGGLPEGVAAIEKMLLGEESSAAPANESAENTEVDSGSNPDALLDSPEGNSEVVDQEAKGDEKSPDDLALEAEEDAQDKPKEGSRAQKRIRDLAAEKNRLKEELAAREQAFEQKLAHQQQQLQYQLQMQQAQMQAALEKQRADFARTQVQLEQFKTTQEEENLGPADKFERKILRDAEQRAEALAQKKYAELEQKLAKFEQEKQQERAQYERQQRYNYYNNQADAVLSNVVLKEFDAKTQEKLKEPTKEALLAWCAAAGQTPEQAAKQFKEFFDTVGQARMASAAQVKGKQIAKNAALPAAGSNRSNPQVSASDEDVPYPTKAELRADGRFARIWDWAQAGRPKLRK